MWEELLWESGKIIIKENSISCFFKKTTPTLLWTHLFKDTHFSQQHAGLHHAVCTPQQEVSRPKGRFKLTLPEKSGGGKSGANFVLHYELKGSWTDFCGIDGSWADLSTWTSKLESDCAQPNQVREQLVFVFVVAFQCKRCWLCGHVVAREPMWQTLVHSQLFLAQDWM